MSAEDFETAVRRLLAQVGHWEAGRWQAPADSGEGTRGALVFALVQRLADDAADAEQRRHRPVPRLADSVLADQLRVMADDLVAAAPPSSTLISATEAVSATRKAL